MGHFHHFLNSSSLQEAFLNKHLFYVEQRKGAPDVGAHRLPLLLECMESESASRPPCGFWRIDDQQLEN
jgi:hypothetical protein